MSKLWDKGYDVNRLLEEFTVGRDYILDKELIAADCAGSIAHARMLCKQGYLSSDQLEALQRELRSIACDFFETGIAIPRSDEDCHTTIENRLVQKLGETGKRIHLGRSRNDQVLTMLRLYGREYLLAIRESLYQLVRILGIRAEENKLVPMPGRTHMHIAMPSSVGLWLAAIAEDLIDSAALVETTFVLLNRSPLGASAGYGVPLDIDREYSSMLMGFASVQNNAISVHNSRGKIESMVCDALHQTMLVLSKAAQDLLLFSLPEFGYFSLPDELCTGSSIMPQKKNPDGLELLRSRTALVGGWAMQIKMSIQSLPSGYNRDFQDSKEPFLRSLETALSSLNITRLCFEKLTVDEDALRRAHAPEIYATDEAFEQVKSGVSFRDAYRNVSGNLDRLKSRDIDKTLAQRTVPGFPGNPNFAVIHAALESAVGVLEKDKLRHQKAVADLLSSCDRLIK